MSASAEDEGITLIAMLVISSVSLSQPLFDQSVSEPPSIHTSKVTFSLVMGNSPALLVVTSAKAGTAANSMAKTIIRVTNLFIGSASLFLYIPYARALKSV